MTHHNNVINTADLFCGAGGSETGLGLALEQLGLTRHGYAVNHWKVAIDTMRINHPGLTSVESGVENIIPEEAIPGGELDLLWASPSCTHHSRAKGGKPLSNQLRAQPELILTWLDQLYVKRLIVENVPEITKWGPLDKEGNKIKAKAGDCFKAWLAAIEARDYTIEWKILNCANYGDPTKRRRFFLQAVRSGCGEITWPDHSHCEHGVAGDKWVGVGTCIDWSDLGSPLSARKKPLSDNTLRRIRKGITKFAGTPFVFDYLRGPGGACINKPIGAQPTHARYALATPFLVHLNKNCETRDTTDPLPTIAAGGQHFALATPFVMSKHSNPVYTALDSPASTVTAQGSLLLCTPMIIGQQSCSTAKPVSRPAPTVSTSGAISMATPLMSEDGQVVDVLFRMLKPRELARAHSFPDDYVLTGNQTEQIKQIGNSVPVMTAKALCLSALSAWAS